MSINIIKKQYKILYKMCKKRAKNNVFVVSVIIFNK